MKSALSQDLHGRRPMNELLTLTLRFSRNFLHLNVPSLDLNLLSILGLATLNSCIRDQRLVPGLMKSALTTHFKVKIRHILTLFLASFLTLSWLGNCAYGLRGWFVGNLGYRPSVLRSETNLQVHWKCLHGQHSTTKSLHKVGLIFEGLRAGCRELSIENNPILAFSIESWRCSA